MRREWDGVRLREALRALSTSEAVGEGDVDTSKIWKAVELTHQSCTVLKDRGRDSHAQWNGDGSNGLLMSIRRVLTQR